MSSRVFDYSPAEWAAIDKAAGRPLSIVERVALTFAADRYIFQSINRSRMRRVVPSRRTGLWKKVASSVEKALENIKDLVAVEWEVWDLRYGPLDDPNGAAAPCWPVPDDIVRMLGGSPETLGSNEISSNLLIYFFERIAQRARSRTHQEPIYPWVSITPRRDPSIIYLQEVTWIWTDELGGKLSISCDSTQLASRYFGPFVDYISAVASPVMKDKTPRSSSLCKLIERQAKFNGWKRQFEARRRKDTPTMPRIRPTMIESALELLKRKSP
jgi:hypothetical protein